MTMWTVIFVYFRCKVSYAFLTEECSKYSNTDTVHNLHAVDRACATNITYELLNRITKLILAQPETVAFN